MCVFQAMAQSRPVLVRENQGNCSIVEDRVTGLVYKTPQVCRHHFSLNFVLFDLILYIPSTISQLYRDGSSWVEPVLS